MVIHDSTHGDVVQISSSVERASSRVEISNIMDFDWFSNPLDRLRTWEVKGR